MTRMLSALLPRLLGAGCLLVLAAAPASEAVAQVRHGSGDYRRPAQVLPSHRPAYRPSQHPGHRPGYRPRPSSHRPGWGHGRPVPVYPRHHHHYYDNDRDDRRSDLGTAIVGGVVGGVVAGIIVNGLQDGNGR